MPPPLGRYLVEVQRCLLSGRTPIALATAFRPHYNQLLRSTRKAIAPRLRLALRPTARVHDRLHNTYSGTTCRRTHTNGTRVTDPRSGPCCSAIHGDFPVVPACHRARSIFPFAYSLAVCHPACDG